MTKFFDIASTVQELVSNEGLAHSQDSTDLFGALNELLPKIGSPRDFEYFKSEIARAYDSDARKLVNSAADRFDTLSDHNGAKVLCLALALGGSTLEIFIDVLVKMPKVRANEVISVFDYYL